MAIFRGVGGSGESSDNSFLQEVTAQANSASASASAAQASATSAANSLAAIQDTEITSASFDTSDGVLTLTKTGGATVTADLDGRFLTSYTETNDLSTTVTWANVPDANITQSSVTQHQAALTITESQISDLQSYLTSYTETNDLSTAVTWANIPDANITQSSVTQHQGALSITESQISDLQTYLTAEANDLSTTVTWANVPDANITESSVTQHQAALSITESQISDLGTYLTASDITGKANLSGADFTGNVSVAGTFNTDDLTTTYSSVDYPLISIGQYTPVLPAMQIGGTESGNKIYAIEMRPAAGGVRMHWHQNTDNISGQTLRFHTTDRGVHVGDDRTGTYTAGDNQNNADVDFGMLVGRESSNLGSNNFGFGYDIDFATGSASNLGAGSLIDVLGTTSNSVAFGGDVKLGKDDPILDTPVTGSLVGGNIARTEGDYSFTWGKGELDENGIYPTVNKGYGCVLFGHITDIDEDSTWSMVGGDIGGAGQPTSINDTHYSLAWGKNVALSNSSGAAVFGNTIAANRASYSLISGNNNSVFSMSCVVGGYDNEVGYQSEGDTRGDYSACFGTDHFVEGRRNFVAGHDNNSLGESGACIGQGLKTPLFQPVGGGAFVWDDYSVVVGGYNDEAHKYYTNNNNTAWVEDHRFVVGTGTSSGAKDNGFIVAVPDSGFCGIIMPNLASSPSYSNDLNAKAGGVPVGGLYRDGNTVKIVLS